MNERSEAWWRAVVACAVLATVSHAGCSATTVHAPSDAAVSDLIVVDASAVVDAPVVDAPPAVDADLVIGAFRADPGGRSAAGVASVFHGSATWTQPAAGTAHPPDRRFEGAAPDDWFGVSVASARDATVDPQHSHPPLNAFTRWAARALDALPHHSPAIPRFTRAASHAPHAMCPIAQIAAALPPPPHA